MASLRIKTLKPVLVLLLVLVTMVHSNARGEDSLSWNPKASAKYLDGRADWWLTWSGAARGQGTSCLSCHTTVPIALARSALGEKLREKAPDKVERKLMDILEKRVANWDKIVAAADSDKDPFVPFYPDKRKPSALGTESVLNALILVNFDVRRGKGNLRASTKTALAHMWQQQQENGAWLWLHFGLNPWENDGAYYGASLAALTLGMAGKDYYDQRALQTKVAALKKYLRTQHSDQPLHHRLTVLWASARFPDILSSADRKKLLEEIRNIQEEDGGWSLAKLGKKSSGKGGWQAHGIYPQSVSDGYATGLVVLALKNAAVSAADAALKKGIAWLASRQKEGTWPAVYPNRPRDPQTDIGKFMRDAATSYDILALTETGN
jgi:squalene-hopene/tetraprenyl-beta-curcumene cyclase